MSEIFRIDGTSSEPDQTMKDSFDGQWDKVVQLWAHYHRDLRVLEGILMFRIPLDRKMSQDVVKICHRD